MTDTFLLPLAGGALIGVAASILLLFGGRIAGISGILGGTLERVGRPDAWRVSFLLGLLAGGVIIAFAYPNAFPSLSLDTKAVSVLAAAGVLVGFGTRLGGGCTSGHGVCGIARLSPRSVVATVVFIAFGALSVAIANLAGLH